MHNVCGFHTKKQQPECQKYSARNFLEGYLLDITPPPPHPPPPLHRDITEHKVCNHVPSH